MNHPARCPKLLLLGIKVNVCCSFNDGECTDDDELEREELVKNGWKPSGNLVKVRAHSLAFDFTEGSLQPL